MILADAAWPPAVAAAISEMITHHGRGGAAFDPQSPPVAALDWDDTCMHGDISETALALLDRSTSEPLVDAYEQGCRDDVRRAYVDLIHTLVAGRSPDEVEALAAAALADGESSGRIVLRPSMAELVRALVQAGFEVCVVTASPELFVRPLATRYGIDERRVLGMQSELGSDGRFVDQLAAPPTHFEGKLATLRATFGRDPLFAAGDSQSDAPMLRSARYALLLDRGDARLRAEAERSGWWIHQGEGA